MIMIHNNENLINVSERNTSSVSLELDKNNNSDNYQSLDSVKSLKSNSNSSILSEAINSLKSVTQTSINEHIDQIIQFVDQNETNPELNNNDLQIHLDFNNLNTNQNQNEDQQFLNLSNLYQENITDFNNQFIDQNNQQFKQNKNSNDNDLIDETFMALNDTNNYKCGPIPNFEKTSTNTCTQLDFEKRIPRPPNAFMIFGQQNRKILAYQFPQYTNKQISKILGDEWRKMKVDEKSHFHRLADEAYAKHMQKYPGYYYSPLEARQRKADRKKKFFQKISSRRNIVRQQTSTNNENLNKSSMNFHLMQNNQSIAYISNSNNLPVNLVNQCNLLDESSPDPTNQSPVKLQKFSSNDNLVELNNDLNLPSQQIQLNQNQTSQVTHQSNICSNSIQVNNQIQNSNNYNNNFVPYYHGSNNNMHNQMHSAQSTSIYNNRNNFVFCHNLFHNNLMQQLINNGSNSNLVQNNLHHHHLRNSLIHHHLHHHNVNSYSTPTICHIPNKDPNLNSTLADSGILNNSNDVSTSSNCDNSNSLHLDVNQFVNNQHQVIIPLHQQLINQQQIQQANNPQQQQQQNDFNSLSLFLPPMDNPSNYITPVGNTFNLDEMILEGTQQSQQLQNNLNKLY